MKKLILLTSLLAFMVTCKKNHTDDAAEEKQITTENKSSEINVQETPSLQEVSAEELSLKIAPQRNDTVYVTNFFATWCPPCMREIPHFVEKMKALKGKPVKFTFVSVDAREDWNTKVKDFADEYDVRKNTVLFDASMISPDYFTKITKTWDGGSIPFTVIKKGNKEIETVGMMTKEDLEAKLNSF